MAYSSIVKPSDYFNTKLYTGNGGTNAITGVGFQPDFTWIKNRSRIENHVLYDAVRGVTKRMESNLTDAESTKTNGLTAFGTDGFTVGSAGQNNYNGDNIASWNWLASNTTASNTDGSITSTVSANTTSGFSIVSYTGTGSIATIGHGLGVAPNVVIVKQRTVAGNHWVMYNSVLPSANYFLYLDSTDGQQTATNFFNNTAPTSSVFTVGTDAQTNGSTNSLIAYCFAEKKGFSKFGNYTGNGNADGTFVYTGFRPAMVIFKNTNAVQDWVIKDNKRPGYNVTDDVLYPNGNYAEGSGADIDLLSNGFKARTTADNTNQSGSNFIYMAFAEEPLVANSGTDGVPATAR